MRSKYALASACPWLSGFIPRRYLSIMTFLTNLLALLVSDALSIWTKVSTSLNLIINEIPDDEITILHGTMQTAATSLQNGRSAEEAFTDALNFLQTQEKKEMSKLGEQLLQAFIAGTAAKASAA
jgi:hypothetical protein